MSDIHTSGRFDFATGWRITHQLFVLLLSLVNLFGASSHAVELPTTPEPSSYDLPLGIALESYPYPYPVHFLPLHIEGQPLRMAYMDVPPSGQPKGQSVLLLHGKNFYASYWENVISRLSDEGYRVIVPDQIGFGKSSKPHIHYSFDLLAANTIQLLDALKVEKVVVVGHSMGGMLAIRFARLYPERVNQLVLENPIGLEDYRLQVPPVPVEKIYEGELGQTTEQIRSFLKRYVVNWNPAIYERYVEVRSRIRLSGEFPRWTMAAVLTYRMVYEQPVRYELPYVKSPTLLVIGQRDRTTLGRGFVPEEVLKTLGNYPELGRSAAKEIPDCKLLELEGVGHIPHLEKPNAFLDALIQFIDH